MLSPRLKAFTLAEVMAALALMAIVIPVAMECTSIASRAGTMGVRKAAAARVAQRVLNEAIATGGTLTGSTGGTVTEGALTYAWTVTTGAWSVDSLELVTATVTFTVQGDSFEVSLSTVVDPTATTTTTGAAGMP